MERQGCDLCSCLRARDGRLGMPGGASVGVVAARRRGDRVVRRVGGGHGRLDRSTPPQPFDLLVRLFQFFSQLRDLLLSLVEQLFQGGIRAATGRADVILLGLLRLVRRHGPRVVFVAAVDSVRLLGLGESHGEIGLVGVVVGSTMVVVVPGPHLGFRPGRLGVRRRRRHRRLDGLVVLVAFWTRLISELQQQLSTKIKGCIF